MYTPRTNWILLGLFGFISIIVFTLALIFPSFRQIAYAPLREFVIPQSSPIVVQVLYSTEKEDWLSDVVPGFEASDIRIDGHSVEIQMEKMGSWEINSAVLDGSRQPVLVSPASTLQITTLQEDSSKQFGTSLVNPADQSTCRSVVKTPLVLVAWKERAEVLWGGQPDEALWQNLDEALVNPQGWAAYNHPDWGYIKFSHTDPLKSNSGFMTILLMTYGYFGTTQGLESKDILTNQDYQNYFLEFEDSIGTFENSTGPLMEKMITYGPSTYDIVTVYEATAIEQADNAVGRYGELRVYYPPALSWSDHPFCIVNGDWVSDAQKKSRSIICGLLA